MKTKSVHDDLKEMQSALKEMHERLYACESYIKSKNDFVIDESTTTSEVIHKNIQHLQYDLGNINDSLIYAHEAIKTNGERTYRFDSYATDKIRKIKHNVKILWCIAMITLAISLLHFII